jgi:hypothetical protein
MISGISNTNTYRQADTNFEESTADLGALVKALSEQGALDERVSASDTDRAADAMYRAAKNAESTEHRRIPWIGGNRC